MTRAGTLPQSSCLSTWGGYAVASETRRLRIQIYVDVLRALHKSRKNGQPLHLYTLERDANLTYPRLKVCLDDLQHAGLIAASLQVTEQGYAFLEEVTSKVAPVMMKYGLWRDRI